MADPKDSFAEFVRKVWPDICGKYPPEYFHEHLRNHLATGTAPMILLPPSMFRPFRHAREMERLTVDAAVHAHRCYHAALPVLEWRKRLMSMAVTRSQQSYDSCRNCIIDIAIEHGLAMNEVQRSR